VFEEMLYLEEDRFLEIGLKTTTNKGHIRLPVNKFR
ncbi:hypothetical protein TNIN_93771, partial [Trichonephila inaurata madagascariensis]